MGSLIQIPIRLSLTSWKNAFDASQEAVRGNRQKNPPLSLVEDQGQSSMSFFRDASLLVFWKKLCIYLLRGDRVYSKRAR